MDVKDFRNGVAPYLMGAVVIVALMLTLIQVLQNAVHRGTTANAAHEARTESQWRCLSTRDPSERDGCIPQRLSTTDNSAPLLASTDVRSY